MTRAPSDRSPKRNPRASPAEHRAVVRLAERLADELDPTGRAAVLLAGSWARGRAHVGSDVDLWVVGSSRRDRLLERDGRMVCVRYSTPARERQEMRDPARLDGAVPGWRHLKILRDPSGVASRLRAEALRFRWAPLRRALDEYVARDLAAWAEEVTKLLRALETGERETAAVQRNLLANRMAFLVLLPRRKFWESENGMWELASRRAGRRFREAQRAALGVDGADWRRSCEAALRLYAETARQNLSRLRGDHRRIVLGTCRRAGYPVAEGRTR